MTLQLIRSLQKEFIYTCEGTGATYELEILWAYHSEG